MTQDKKILEKSKRMDILISSMAGEKKVGNTTKVTFNGIVDGVNLKYDTFNPNLAKTIRENEGKTLPMDVEISEHIWSGVTYTDRVIQQIYVDGQPIQQRGAVSQRSASGGYREDSPETRASIEAQTAYNGVVQMMVAKVAPKELENTAILWATSKLAQGHEATPPEKRTLVDEALAMGAERLVDFDSLYQMMNDAKWKASTVKSWCLTKFKLKPESMEQDFEAFINSLTKEQVETLIKQLQK